MTALSRTLVRWHLPKCQSAVVTQCPPKVLLMLLQKNEQSFIATEFLLTVLSRTEKTSGVRENFK